MAVNPNPDELRRALAELGGWRVEHLRGDEKGEAQIFLDRLFRAFGHAGIREAGGTLEERLKRNDAKGTAFADLVWKPRCLVEMKRSGVDLSRHYRQAFDYWIQAVPDRPRYVVLCNFDEFWIYDFDSQLDEPIDRVPLNNLASRWDALAFLLPVEEAPVFRNNLVEVTRDAAAKVARVFSAMHLRGVERAQAQRFTLQAVMAMFSEDIGLLPGHYFTAALDDSLAAIDPARAAYETVFGLFREMNAKGSTPGGRYRGTPYFDGGLFSEITPFEITKDELASLREASTTDWSAVRPEIFGTLFEQSMDAGERHAYGAHFTSQADIAKIVIPTIVTPWRERIAETRARGKGGIDALLRLLGELLSFRVLDPACGSGNFLYVAYREMRRIEQEFLSSIEDLRRSKDLAAQRAFAYVTPDHFFGMDRNPFAVEVAKVTMMLAKKLAADELDDNQAVLPLDNLDDTIIAADALFTPWPESDVVIGNPPYLGRRKMVEELGAEYCQRLAARHPQVGGVSDFVTYWFPLAHDHLPDGGRAGLVATNSIRQNESRVASLDYVVDNGGVIFDAVASQIWSGDAVVHVSLVNWIKNRDVYPKILWLNEGELRLEVDYIPPSLSPQADVRRAADLEVNKEPVTCFQGQTPGVTDGYVLDAATRSDLIERSPPSAAVIFPFLGGRDILRLIEVDRWIIDIAEDDLLVARTKYPSAMAHLARYVLPERQRLLKREEERNAAGLAESPSYRPENQHLLFMNRWWMLWRRRPDLLAAIAQLDRYIATSRVGGVNRATVFQFVDSGIRPGDSTTVFALDDDYSFGVLSSALHRMWLEARCSTLKGDLRYTSTTVWESYPWPQSPSRDEIRTITEIVAELLELRANYLSRGVNLAKQYDSLREPGQSRLRSLHSELDDAVFTTYGFSHAEDVLAQLLALNQDVAADALGARGPGGGGLSEVRVSDYRLTSTRAA